MRLSLYIAVLCSAAFASPHPVSQVLQEAVRQKQIPGAVIVVQQHGKIVFEEAAGLADIAAGRNMRIDGIFMMASSSKPIAATAILTLVDRGKLSLDDPVTKYFPTFQGSSTIRQLLCHTSGIFGNGTPEMTEPIRNFDRSLKDAVEMIVKLPLVYTPGEKYSYGGASFCVAGRIAEILTVMDFEEYAAKALFQLLNMKDTVYRTARDITGRVPLLYTKKNGQFEKIRAVMEPPDHAGPRKDGFVLVPGVIYSTGHDLIQFLQMHLNGGTLQGKRILSNAMVVEMRRKQTGDLKEEYGLGWQRSKVGKDGVPAVVSHGGAYGTEIFIDTGKDLVGAILTQMPSAQAKPFITEIRNAIDSAF
ncbi:MAG: serine hydrolase domain-containing protein [Bryobacteraceae bacterium]